MTKVNFQFSKFLPGMREPIKTGKLIFKPTKRVSVGNDLVLPEPFPIIIQGESMIIDLQATSATWAWEITLVGKFSAHYDIPNTTNTLQFNTLVPLNPDTLTEGEPDPAWQVKLDQLIALGGVPGAPGEDGESAYQIAVENGFTGNETQWMLSLKGRDGADSEIPGPQGNSAYQIAVAEGFNGTQDEWLESLHGEDSTIPGPPGKDGLNNTYLGNNTKLYSDAPSTYPAGMSTFRGQVSGGWASICGVTTSYSGAQGTGWQIIKPYGSSGPLTIRLANGGTVDTWGEPIIIYTGLASPTSAGYMSAADKIKLNAL